ncbi:cytidylyltransferase family protein [Desulfovibrio sp. A2]|nr:cytidylyltransferase family protein [Desulfovibrio sp. A2]
MRRILTVIPARGGSKGLPGKNIRPLGGIPLIAWAIKKAAAAGASPCIISTDDEEIAETARRCGGNVPFLRPPSLGTDTSTLLQVNHHALTHFDERGQHFDAVLTIHVTAPLISAAIVRQVIDTFHATNALSVATVTKIRHGHPLQAKRLLQDGTLREYIDRDGDMTRYSRQQREPLYYPNCGVYLRDRSLVEAMDRSTNGLGASPLAVVVPPEQAVDIDEEIDFLLAETIIASGLIPGSDD